MTGPPPSVPVSAVAAAGGRPVFPAAAAPYLDELRGLCRVGHIRGVEGALATLVERVPASAAGVAVMREHVRNFDLRSVMKLLDDDSG